MNKLTSFISVAKSFTWEIGKAVVRQSVAMVPMVAAQMTNNVAAIQGTEVGLGALAYYRGVTKFARDVNEGSYSSLAQDIQHMVAGGALMARPFIQSPWMDAILGASCLFGGGHSIYQGLKDSNARSNEETWSQTAGIVISATLSALSLRSGYQLLDSAREGLIRQAAVDAFLVRYPEDQSRFLQAFTPHFETREEYRPSFIRDYLDRELVQFLEFEMKEQKAFLERRVDLNTRARNWIHFVDAHFSHLVKENPKLLHKLINVQDKKGVYLFDKLEAGYQFFWDPVLPEFYGELDEAMDMHVHLKHCYSEGEFRKIQKVINPFHLDLSRCYDLDEIEIANKHSSLKYLSFKKEYIHPVFIVEAKEDWNHAFQVRDEPAMQAIYKQHRKVYATYASTVKELCKNLFHAHQLAERPIEVLLIRAHGTPEEIILSYEDGGVISAATEWPVGCIENYLARRGVIILEACSTGKGKENIAKKIARLFPGKKIIAVNQDAKIGDLEYRFDGRKVHAKFYDGPSISGHGFKGMNLKEFRKSITSEYQF